MGWNLVMTPLILALIKYVLRVPLRYPYDKLIVGDDAIHGEGGYALIRRRQPAEIAPNPNPAPELEVGAPLQNNPQGRPGSGTVTD
jgi:hypothetical protein